jgi:hypothetical protein
MIKTPFKYLADVIGYGEATAITATLTDLHTHVARVNAELKAQGKPTLDEEAEEAMQILIEQYEAGELENDPDLKEIAMEAKLERKSDGNK